MFTFSVVLTSLLVLISIWAVGLTLTRPAAPEDESRLLPRDNSVPCATCALLQSRALWGRLADLFHLLLKETSFSLSLLHCAIAQSCSEGSLILSTPDSFHIFSSP